jgi:hypothetical protein
VTPGARPWRRDCVLNGCLNLAPLCQILIASARGENAYQIAHELGCNPQTARNAIHAFNERDVRRHFGKEITRLEEHD